ncbi:MAG: transcription antitermination factor NusB [Sedimentisphaerales bacterium]|nr:transcription antitermination factor NusB [Sedimentisphaerales bacterium]
MKSVHEFSGNDEADHPDPSGDPRHTARQLAMQFLYQLAVQDGQNIGQMDVFLDEFAPDPAIRALARTWIIGAYQQRPSIDEQIQAVSDNWDLSRISQVDCSILELSLYQLLFCPEIPPKVILNEAVELAKRFSTSHAPAFVNGILDTIWKRQQRSIPPQSAKEE